ncbi:hypothetical protein [uncultured Thiocystis sp.]|jgi:hypothetical protein|uniref:hypothetical protein n=1 Tax=uncultured Thiocystis sp. TaxID=1202134 RepID=UPI0025E327CF|nr:hypothetical protein [uncultured Thiocystis sp.]
MKAIPARKVRRVLKSIGLRPATKGCGTGHEVWADSAGRTCHPVLRHHDLPWQYLVPLSWELHSKGICSRNLFFQQVRSSL